MFVYKVKLADVNNLRAVSGDCVDECVIRKVDKPDESYRLHVHSETQSWQK